MLTAEILARLLFDEFDKRDWGDIDPLLFRDVAECELERDPDATVMAEVLDDVAERANRFLAGGAP